MHRLVALVALVTHLVFVGFTILGGFLAWFVAPWILVPHVLSALWGARMAVWRPVCPLSTAENWGRRGTGREDLDQEGFIAHYFVGKVYPTSWTRRVEVVVGTLIVGSWIGFSVR